jgi:hypothetical protein
MNMNKNYDMNGNVPERGVDLVEDNNNHEHIALVVVSPPGEIDKISQLCKKEEQQFMALMNCHILRGEEDHRRFEECSIRTMDDLRMLQSSDLTLLFPAPRDFMIRRRLGYIMEYLQKYRTTMERNQSLQLQNMTMQMIIDSLCHSNKQRHWCSMVLDSPMVILSILWLVIICITGYFLTHGQ